ncbi:class II 3-deoxy-7-phosphoheptulonate synthase [Streptomyces sp. NL15-2K]|uniref:class II 3-deoxy-7-phosphoheptulonate synthase n=1 Tax=Streptomyces sp. NL15-2K TaxID=376149 RepID=UPI000F58C1ED|nr:MULTISPECIES: 3-deoxy-7-phosphoheptulonate synthase class II [Actinomycetes]WKX07500.1 3-deoxy-7-phosphoheptulonate synthase class II [Kutzneria buriramensis]GCB51254.1 2-keto-3-deoxy-D-arabino-heptulosonate-7-phosphate synthase II [Streptomyces sp. NL15-2K]
MTSESAPRSHEAQGGGPAPADQQPDWPDPVRLRDVTDQLAQAAPLVFAAECDALRSRLAAVAKGEALLLQGGDCAETFAGATQESVDGKLRTLLQMAVVLTHGASMPVVKVGRMAGQFAKPRSQPFERRGDTTLPVYRGGDAVNGPGFTVRERTPDPDRLLRMYEASATTLNLVRALTAGGFADLARVHEWNRAFVAASPSGRRYERLADEIERAPAFLRACGGRTGALTTAEFFVSHEGLLLDYERALTRTDAATGRTYATSGHLLWIGERTRRPDGPHVEYFAKISNPLAVKLGPGATADTVLRYVDLLDPDREPGRLTFVVRMGAERVRDLLPLLVEKVASEEAPVCWVSDPMHGNTFVTESGHKTRHFDAVAEELRGFVEVHRALGTHPGGVHLELTGDDVTECLGGSSAVARETLPQRYETACDPRLNHSQALDLAFLLAEWYRNH